MRDFTAGPGAQQLGKPAHAPYAALMIDFDNVTMGVRSDLQNQLRALMNSEIIKGNVSVQRAYADWRRYPQYIVPLSEASIDLIFAPAFGSNKKNATDIRLAIDALELVFTRPEIGVFILLSGDSDFSSLVLKLKEYVKYVIGVGIRESSSDLLIQNCDEYYSYNELTGFTKEGEIDAVSMDPWELVVLAVTKMKKNDDVMRSDRLKQVMQSIDRGFDEKGAGFNRFSKFILEAQQRGLVSLEKLDNGQLGIDIGDNANVSPEDEEAFREGNAAPQAGRTRRRSRSRAPAKRSALALAEAFDLLREALGQLGATESESVAADAVRERMSELFSGEDDPLFERARFQRLMRQANDANLIELVKQDDEYVMRMGAAGVVSPDGAGQDDEATEAPSPTKTTKRKRTTRKKATKETKTTRSKAATKRTGRIEDAESGVAATPDDAPLPGDESSAPPARARSTRHRGGSKRGTPARKSPASEDAPAQDSNPIAPELEPQVRSSGAQKSLGPRRGSGRGSRGKKAATGAEAAPKVEPTQEAKTPEPPAPKPEVVAPSPPPPPPPSSPPAVAEGGLLKRMSAAIQKVMRTPEDE